MQSIQPCLFFKNQAEEAANFYVSTFLACGKKNSKVTNVVRYGEPGPGPKGDVMAVEFMLDGQDFFGLNGNPASEFTEAFSFMIRCKDQKEMDAFWSKLTAEGGQEIQCGWLKDKYGFRWQIIPENLSKYMSKDQATTDRIMTAVMAMVRPDFAKYEKAYEGKSKTKKCPQCETEMPENKSVCPKCGKKFDTRKKEHSWPPPEGKYGLEGCNE